MGHNVRAADDKALKGWADPDLFDLAAHDGRIMVTANARDFLRLAKEWQDAGRDHAGLIILPPTIRHHHFGVIISTVQAELVGTTQREWQNKTVLASSPLNR